MDNISFCFHAKKITFSSIFAKRSGGKNIVHSFFSKWSGSFPFGAATPSSYVSVKFRHN
jgi:hypothetical protein